MKETGFILFPCPCCGFKTVSRPFDVCRICCWRCNPSMTDDPDYTTPSEPVSLRQAQKNFITIGAFKPEAVPWTRKPAEGDQRSTTWEPLGDPPGEIERLTA